ncbi:bifunctional heptose 7-phosphate kinase/heptose 1-phosphate adenyltransferase [Methanothermococcus okinawensis]|uniref:PfkB domain protein n=1 Tax=Methanothermococcus okinawensis (strain DSM 14208 / JCM 11175 / IH1) TaxID=647113 RepID=F8AMJ7_METOI|nr:PfkB family carbohydrate kinase [Methanothermococcus okinawensis]AEH06037.1 PfkB domain protein [Methanothermococcus okinawensis IH1]
MICVLGDVMLDKYTYGKVERINPEAPVPVLNVVKERYTLGGAGNVANNISSLNEEVVLLGICNENGNFGRQMVELCRKKDIKYYFISDGRPTIVKHRFVALGYNQQLLRVDYEEKHPLNGNYSKMFVDKIVELNPDILIISDYAKGVITEDLMETIKKQFKGRILIDPKPDNIHLYKNVYLIKPNLKEASGIVGRDIKNTNEDVEKAGLDIVGKYNANVVITRSEKGSTLITLDGEIYHIPTEAKEIHDVSGAGDTYIATLGYALSKKYDLVDAVNLANKASSIVVGKVGTATVSLEELFSV